MHRLFRRASSRSAAVGDRPPSGNGHLQHLPRRAR